MLPTCRRSAIFGLSATVTKYSLAITNALRQETDLGISDVSARKKFQSIVECSVTWLTQTVKQHKQEGMDIIGFGAAAKAMTVLNCAGLKLDYIVDDNALRQGVFLLV
jgi:hypothetical protein